MMSNEEARFNALLADVVSAIAAGVLAQRIEQAQQGRKLAEQQQEAKGLADAVDDWLSGEGNQ